MSWSSAVGVSLMLFAILLQLIAITHQLARIAKALRPHHPTAPSRRGDPDAAA